jgi:two-component system NtrC family sensor kinase
MTPEQFELSLGQMTQIGADIRRLGEEGLSMEETAGRIVRYLRGTLIAGPHGILLCSLVRLFKTHSYSNLSPDLQESARAILSGHEPFPEMKCLTLLATAGDLPEWNRREASVDHKAIPLPSEAFVARFPMISQLINQFGLETSAFLRPRPEILVNVEEQKFNVFHIANAEGSPYVPAQEDFVVPFGIKSVLGFGSLLPSGSMFAVIMFSRFRVSASTANMLAPISLSTKLALLPVVDEGMFPGRREGNEWGPS